MNSNSLNCVSILDTEITAIVNAFANSYTQEQALDILCDAAIEFDSNNAAGNSITETTWIIKAAYLVGVKHATKILLPVIKNKMEN